MTQLALPVLPHAVAHECALSRRRRPSVYDLFCGMGGLSLGFKGKGFAVVGFDSGGHAVAAYGANVGPARKVDLRVDLPEGRPTVVVGGPPCRPWAPINLHRRRSAHADYELVDRFRQAVEALDPCVFVLENVPLLRQDPQFQRLLADLEGRYEIHGDVFSYGDWGAASRRRRLFAIGVAHSHGWLPTVVSRLMLQRKPAVTVGDALRRYSRHLPDPTRDHEWPNLRTIGKYEEKYAQGKFGWYRLNETEPAPSFGNVSKTYTLRKGLGKGPDRALSPREAIAILGFSAWYRFPQSIPRTARYLMAADAVSPVFAKALASAIRESIVDSLRGT
jgi:DNA (cytosine-5)-methyltransferase 1